MPHFHCKGTGLIPSWGIKIPHATWWESKKAGGGEGMNTRRQSSLGTILRDCLIYMISPLLFRNKYFNILKTERSNSKIYGCAQVISRTAWDGKNLELEKPEFNSNYYHSWRPQASNSEKAMAPHSSTLAWKIPWMEEPGGLQSMGSLRVRHNQATSLSLFPFMHWRRKWQPTPVFLPGESQGQGSLMGCCL